MNIHNIIFSLYIKYNLLYIRVKKIYLKLPVKYRQSIIVVNVKEGLNNNDFKFNGQLNSTLRSEHEIFHA